MFTISVSLLFLDLYYSHLSFFGVAGRPIGNRYCLPTVVVEGNTGGTTRIGVPLLRKKMEYYLNPGSPVVFFIGIVIVGVPVTDEEKNFCWVCEVLRSCMIVEVNFSPISDF